MRSVVDTRLSGLLLSFCRSVFRCTFLLHLEQSSFPPEFKHLRDVSHSVVGVEESCHRVQQVLVFVQVTLTLNQIELELLADELVLQRGIAVDVFYQLRQKVSRLRDLRISMVTLTLLFYVLKFIVLLEGSFIIEYLNISFLGAVSLLALVSRSISLLRLHTTARGSSPMGFTISIIKVVSVILVAVDNVVVSDNSCLAAINLMMIISSTIKSTL